VAETIPIDKIDLELRCGMCRGEQIDRQNAIVSVEGLYHNEGGMHLLKNDRYERRKVDLDEGARGNRTRPKQISLLKQ
jgi:hypothetical protein